MAKITNKKLSIDVNMTPVMQKHMHYSHPKDMLVLHETVSPDIAGLSDIVNNENYLASLDYGIHGITDLEGHIAWAMGLGEAVFWQCGGVNERSEGIEQVTDIPQQLEQGMITILKAKEMWRSRTRQLDAAARLVACTVRAHPDIKLQYSDGLHPGITTHWDVSQHFTASMGHTDCHPIHKGGYYPVLWVVERAKQHYAAGLHF